MPPSVPGPAPELLLVVALLALVVACARPRAFLLVALASLAVRPEALFGGAALSHAWGIQHTLLSAALVGCAWRYGLRREVNWPVLAFATAFALSFLLGDLHPDLAAWSMLGALGVLCLPWLFAQVALPPGSRRTCALLLALLPSMNVLVALLLQSPDLVYGVFVYKDFEGSYRLVGPAGDPGLLAVMAFAGFAVALHEATRPGRPWAPTLAVVNLGIVILTVTRVGILASLFLLLTYIALSPVLRERILRRRGLLMLGAGVVLALFAATLPSMLQRVTSGPSWILAGGRNLIWPFYWEQFLVSPIFGRGFGTGFLDLGTQVPRKSPHNEYLHLLVIGGVAGLVLCLTAIAAWFWRLLSRLSPNDREFVLALLPAIAMFAMTEDVLTLSGALVLWAYLGTLLTRPVLLPAAWDEEWHAEEGGRIGHAPLAGTSALATHERWQGWQAPHVVAAGAAQWHRVQAAGHAAAAPGDGGAGPEGAEGGALVSRRPLGLAALERRSLAVQQMATAAGSSEPAAPPRPAPPDRVGAARSYYWVKTFPRARLLFNALAADKLVTLLLLAVLASLAISPSDVLGAQVAGSWERSWHKLLLLAAVGLLALRSGLRLLPNRVLVALTALVLVNLILADRLEGLSGAMTLKAFVGLALPWLFIHVVFDRRALPYYAIALISAPLVSSLLGIVIDPDWSAHRFGGMTNAAFLGASAFFGFAIAAYEFAQRRQPAFAALALTCAVVAILSGSRMAWLSSLIFVCIMYLQSARFRESIISEYRIVVPTLVCAVIVLVLYVPFMEYRVASRGFSGRDTIWDFFLYEVGRSMFFGRGLGASEMLRLQHGMAATHNEYIRMLVDAGVVGLVLFLLGIAAWFRQLLRLLGSEQRAFVWAMIPCLAFYAATDNILAMMPALAVFVYFGMLIDDPVGPGDGPLVEPGQRARL